MKTSLLVLLVLAFSARAVCADSALPAHLGLAPISASETLAISNEASTPALSLASTPAVSAPSFTLQSSSSDFAQLNTSRATPLTLPLSPGFILFCIAVFVLALRVIGLNHARAMAEHEHDSYHGKAQMFRTLHEDGAGR